MKHGERKASYDESEGCDHDYDEDEDALEYVCMVPGCGDRQPIPLDRIMRR